MSYGVTYYCAELFAKRYFDSIFCNAEFQEANKIKGFEILCGLKL